MSTRSDTREGLVLGGDVGGTSTRIHLADLTGRVVARGLGPGGNPVAHPDTAREAFAAALAQALADSDPTSVRVGVIGMAGLGAVRDPGVRDGYAQLWHAKGLAGEPDIRSDLEVAFAAGTEVTEGSVLIAGTGAVSGRLLGGNLVASVGGAGWLLGDEGSGFWLGREAVRAVLRAIEGTGPAGEMTAAVMRALEVGATGAEARLAVIAAAYARPPVALSGLAPLVTRAHLAGDRGATEILDAAASHLLTAWDGLGLARPSGPVVLAGSLTAPNTHLGTALRTGLAARSAVPHTADEPVSGAVRLAIRVAHSGSR